MHFCQAPVVGERDLDAAVCELAGSVVAILSGLSSAAPRCIGFRPRSRGTLASVHRRGVSSPLGFSPASRARQLEAEAKALAVPTPENARKWLKTLTEEPHVAGTPADYKTAVFVRDRLREWGWKAELVPYEVLLNYPEGKPTLQLNQPQLKNLALDEAPLAPTRTPPAPAPSARFTATASAAALPDRSSTRTTPGPRTSPRSRSWASRSRQDRAGPLRRQFPRAEGAERPEARGQGHPDLFRPGRRRLRQGRRLSRRPVSPRLGDPARERAVPFSGPGRSLDAGRAVGQGRRSAADCRSTDDPRVLAIRASRKEWEGKTGLKREDYFATIPSLPISYDTAREIFRVLAGPDVPSGWQGGLPLAYHVGPGPAEVGFSVRMDYQIRTIWNVIATIPGTVEPDRWVMVGNHRDAWVYGAVDPGSGTAATLEMCRAIGAAVKDGWKPRRTLVYASWDAEEYGLVGSTEWAEEHADDRRPEGRPPAQRGLGGQRAGPGHGRSSLASRPRPRRRRGRHRRPVGPIAPRDLAGGEAVGLGRRQPAEPGRSSSGTRPTAGSSTSHAGSRPRGFVPQLHPLGSGSDYTVFLDHLGVPALDIGFSGRYGVYHSIYDDFNWMEKFGDPEFLTHTMAARLYTVLVMRAAAAEVLPLRFAPYGEALRDHVDELRLIEARRARAKPDKPGQAGSQSRGGGRGFDESCRCSSPRSSAFRPGPMSWTGRSIA